MAEFVLELLQHMEEKETSLLRGGKISVPRYLYGNMAERLCFSPSDHVKAGKIAI